MECDDEGSNLCLALFELLLMVLFRSYGLGGEDWAVPQGICDREGLPQLGLVGLNSTFCLDGPSPDRAIRSTFVDPPIRTLTGAMRAIGSRLPTLEDTGPAYEELADLSRRRYQRAAELLQSDEGLVFRAKKLTSRQMRIPLLSRWVYPHFQDFTNAQLVSMEFEPLDDSDTLLSARVYVWAGSNRKTDG